MDKLRPAVRLAGRQPQSCLAKRLVLEVKLTHVGSHVVYRIETLFVFQSCDTGADVEIGASLRTAHVRGMKIATIVAKLNVAVLAFNLTRQGCSLRAAPSEGG